MHKLFATRGMKPELGMDMPQYFTVKIGVNAEILVMQFRDNAEAPERQFYCVPSDDVEEVSQSGKPHDLEFHRF